MVSTTYFRDYQRKHVEIINPRRVRYRRNSYLRNPVAAKLSTLKSKAIKKGIKFILTRDWALKKYTGFCALTGLKFKLTNPVCPYSPSVDKIDPNKGYTPKNCRIILFGVNTLKGRGSDKDMYKIAKALLNRKKK